MPRKFRGPLKVLYAGGINLRKGLPFLVDAVRTLHPHATLTLVGSLDPDVKSCLAGTHTFATVLPPVSKLKLRDIYRAHDILVLPSLGDSFGFVAMEAMACGLPVIVTTHCGVPVPDFAWRVPVMDVAAIVDRLNYYIDDPRLLQADRIVARTHATNFTPDRYRNQVKVIYTKIIKSS
jgi:glycosyltransferase involved in cell wall biosynthesis